MRVFISIVLLFILASCSEKKNGRTIVDHHDFVTHEIADDGIADVEDSISLPINLDSLYLKTEKPFNGFVFLLNAECSFCIVQLLNFISYCNIKAIDFPIVAVVEEGCSSAVNYQIKSIGLRPINDFTTVENINRRVLTTPLEPHSGTVFLYKEGEIHAVFLLNKEVLDKFIDKNKAYLLKALKRKEPM